MITITTSYPPLPVEKRLKAGIIGLGNQAISEHFPALLASDNYDPVALCDKDPEIISQTEGEYGKDYRYYTDVAQMLAECKLDIAIVAVPHDEYLSVVELCAQNRVHVLKEKPFARNMAEAIRLQATATDSGIHLMTTFQRRFHPLYQAFVPMLAQIGKIHSITCLYAISSNNPNSGWRGEATKAGGGVMLDMGYHVLDMLIWFMDKPTILSSTMQISKPIGYDVEDVAQFTFEVSGAFGTGLISCVHPRKHEELVFIGERGSAVLMRDRIERYNNNQILVDYLESSRSWTAAMINQLDYFAMVITGKIGPKYSTPDFQIKNHVEVIDTLYKLAKGESS